METKQYGWYSKEAAVSYDTSFWLTPDGNEVEVTNVSLDPEGKEYKWADKQFVGEVTKWSRPGTRGLLSYYRMIGAE